jgi:hypothetical protein
MCPLFVWAPTRLAVSMFVPAVSAITHAEASLANYHLMKKNRLHVHQRVEDKDHVATSVRLGWCHSD